MIMNHPRQKMETYATGSFQRLLDRKERNSKEICTIFYLNVLFQKSRCTLTQLVLVKVGKFCNHHLAQSGRQRPKVQVLVSECLQENTQNPMNESVTFFHCIITLSFFLSTSLFVDCKETIQLQICSVMYTHPNRA